MVDGGESTGFDVSPFLVLALVEQVKVVIVGDQAIVGVRCDVFGDGRGDEVPAVVVGGISRDVFLYRGFHAIRVVDELGTVFKDKSCRVSRNQ